MSELIVFTKVPEKGYVKTKLNKRFPLHLVEELYTAFLVDTLDKLSDFDPYVAYYPEKKLQMLWNILGDRKYIVQKGKGIWERKARIFDGFYRSGYGYVAAVHCDVPLLDKALIEDAFSLMADNDIIIGPAADGGIYFIGGTKVTPELFDGVEWKDPGSCERIRENARALGLTLVELAEQQDVDTPEDLAAVWQGGNLDKSGKTYEVMRKAFRGTLVKGA